MPLFLFGVLLGTDNPRLLFALVLLPPLVQPQNWLPSQVSNTWWPVAAHLLQTLPLIGAAMLGAAWEPFALVLDRLRESRVASLAVLNLLNLIDAAMTTFALRSGQAAEANPVVRWIGLPVKVILVGAVSLLLSRMRPRAVVWPALVMAGVLVWHLAGLALNGRG